MTSFDSWFAKNYPNLNQSADGWVREIALEAWKAAYKNPVDIKSILCRVFNTDAYRHLGEPFGVQLLKAIDAIEEVEESK